MSGIIGNIGIQFMETLVNNKKENDNEMMIMLIAFYGIFACLLCAFVCRCCVVFELKSERDREIEALIVEVNLKKLKDLN